MNWPSKIIAANADIRKIQNCPHIKANNNVDNDIIAGLIFNIDETIIDNSIRHKLEDLSKGVNRIGK